MTTATVYGTPGIALPESDECGTPIALPDRHAEYKQVTVLFADVIRLTDVAQALDPNYCVRLWPRCSNVAQ
jgi:hypothetical protein